MKIVALNPPFHPKFSRAQRSPAVTKGGTLYYPIWLAYATGVMEAAGHEVMLLDAPARGLDLSQVLQAITSFSPSLVVLDTSTPSINNDVGVAAAIKGVLPGTFTVAVGTHASALPAETLGLTQAIDAVARREYDFTVTELASSIEMGSGPGSVAGLSYHTAREVVHNTDRPLVQDLDVLPFVSSVYKRHLRIEDYCYAMSWHPVVTVITGRGCPYQCTYCVTPQVLHMRGYRRRGVASVVGEFAYIQEELPRAREVFIEDDTFTVDIARCREICMALIKRGIHLRWSANSRADVDYETLRTMKDAGCRSLCVGFESGSQTVLDGVDKKITLERMHTFMTDARRAGLLVHGCFMVGHAGETRDSMISTLKFAKELNPDTAQFLPLMVYPGTIAYEQAKQSGLLTTEDYGRWLTAQGFHNTVVKCPDLTSNDLISFCHYARRDFYLRPRYISAKFRQMLFQPADARRTFRAFRSFLPHLLGSSNRR